MPIARAVSLVRTSGVQPSGLASLLRVQERPEAPARKTGHIQLYTGG